MKIGLIGVSFERSDWKFVGWVFATWISSFLLVLVLRRLSWIYAPADFLPAVRFALQWPIPFLLHIFLAWQFGLFRRSPLTIVLVAIACILLPLMESFAVTYVPVLTLFTNCFFSAVLGVRGQCV